MNKVTNVRVLSNLVRLGVKNRMGAYSGLRRWRRMQSITQQVLKARSFEGLPWIDEANLPSDCGDRLFVSFHYGLWSVSLLAVAKATQCHRVYCLVDRPEPIYCARLATLAQASGIEMVVLPSERTRLPCLRQAQAEGSPNVANMADLKVSRVNQTLYEQVLQVKRFTLQGLPLHAVSLLTDIHASTNLELGAVF